MAINHLERDCLSAKHP